MCKESWCVGLGQEGLHEGGGKYLEKGWNRKEGSLNSWVKGWVA